MSPELVFWLALTTKMAVTALFVSAATIIAERLGAAVGALVATLPVSAGPVYVFLALDHDATFISASAVASLAMNTATAIFITVYVLIAQRRSLWISVSLAITVWLTVTLALVPVHWTAPSALGCFRSVCVDRQTVWPGGYAADDTALVRLRDEGRHGRTTGRRGRYSKFSNWSNGKRRACCVPGYLHEYYADLASPRRRSCHGRSASECCFRPCRFWCSVANAASRGSAVWISPGPHCCPQRLRCLECRPIYCTASQIGLSKTTNRVQRTPRQRDRLWADR